MNIITVADLLTIMQVYQLLMIVDERQVEVYNGSAADVPEILKGLKVERIVSDTAKLLRVNVIS